MHIEWSEEKNKKLKAERGFSFEDVVAAISLGKLLDNRAHPNPEYQHQNIAVVNIEGYAVMVPYVTKEDGTLFFLNSLSI
ncbi:toxin [Piscirickettsia salmonis]|uniref:toxin n=1 Tax=Piscirickettsia salmonis TaxID=1238 RepID=UPI00143D5E7F|nr:toxin [Piscirickettsia salmonis]QIX55652.1 toxin [Piscirickettsia salmonis]